MCPRKGSFWIHAMTLTLVFSFIIIITQENSATFVWLKLKCLFWRQETIGLCPPVNDNKGKETNTSCCLWLAIYLKELNGLFTLFLTSSSWSIKAWHPGLTKWLFWDFNLPSSWSTGSLNKIIFLFSTPCLSDSLAYHVASRVSLTL